MAASANRTVADGRVAFGAGARSAATRPTPRTKVSTSIQAFVPPGCGPHAEDFVHVDPSAPASSLARSRTGKAADSCDLGPSLACLRICASGGAVLALPARLASHEI